MPTAKKEQYQSRLTRMVEAGLVDEMVAMIRDGLPLTEVNGRHAASWERAQDLLLAYKQSKHQHAAVYAAWIDAICQAVPPDRLHTELATVFLPVLSKQKAEPRAVRALLDAIEVVMPDFLERPVDERGVPKTLIAGTKLLRAWEPGQPQRTILGIMADTPAYYPQDLWEVCLPQRLGSLPFATTEVDLLEYLPDALRDESPGKILRERLKPSEDDLVRMGSEALERLSESGLYLVCTPQPYGLKQPPARRSALGAVLRLDAGAVVPDAAWICICDTQVTVEPGQAPLPLIAALASHVAWGRSARGAGTTTIRRMLESGAVDVNSKVAPEGSTLLHIAAHGRNHGLVEMLLSFGADPTIPNASGKRPRDLAKTPFPGSTELPPAEIALMFDACAARSVMKSVIKGSTRGQNPRANA